MPSALSKPKAFNAGGPQPLTSTEIDKQNFTEVDMSFLKLLRTDPVLLNPQHSGASSNA